MTNRDAPDEPAVSGPIDLIFQSLATINAAVAQIAPSEAWRGEDVADDLAFEHLVQKRLLSLTPAKRRSLARGLAALVTHLKHDTDDAAREEIAGRMKEARFMSSVVRSDSATLRVEADSLRSEHTALMSKLRAAMAEQKAPRT